MRLLKRALAGRRAIVLVLLQMVLGATLADAQVFELRHLFESFQDLKILVGGGLDGPVNSKLDPTTARVNIQNSLAAEVEGQVSIDYWQLRGGVRFYVPNNIAPFIFWNPIVGDKFGGPKSRWSASLGWEGMFATVPSDYDPQAIMQADNSVYSPANSFSAMVGYWFGSATEDRLSVDTNYAGRGFVDTMTYRTEPLDTNSYIRGRLLPSEVPGGGKVIRYSSRNGLSVGLGFGTGKYAGSGPISKFLNFLYPGDNSQDVETRGTLLDQGLNPMMVVRYRYNDYIGQLDVAGEDVNLGAIYRGVKDFDFELGVKYLEHLFDRASRGPNRSSLFLGVRYAPPLEPGYDRFEVGDEIYDPASDSDGDGLPDGVEINVTHTDPTKADTDDDGLPDGVEVYSYKTNPNMRDSDGDGLADGQEINAQQRTDPLRPDTDGDGIPDGADSAPLTPGGTGVRGR